MFDFTYLDHLDFPIFVLELDEFEVPRYAAVNAFMRRSSCKPLRHYVGRTAEDVYAGQPGRAAFAKHCAAARSGQKVTYQIKLPINGKNRTVRTTLSPMCNQVGEVQWLVGNSQALGTEEAELKATEPSEHLSNEMTQFVAIAAHDLRAPMRNVAVLADMLRDGESSSPTSRSEIIDMLESVAHTSQALIKDVLSNAQACTSAETPSVVNLRTLCNELCAVLDPSARLTLTVPSVTLRLDRCMLQIALRNTLENALKHADQDDLEISISAHQHGAKMVRLAVCDNGAGFSPSALAFLDSGTFKIDSGYGLFGVRRLVNDRGGMIRAYNMADLSGAVVELTLPGVVMPTSPQCLPSNGLIPYQEPTFSLRHLQA